MPLTQLYKPCAEDDSLPGNQPARTSPPAKRRRTETRPLKAKLGLLSDATGSALVELGSTRVLCAILGPYPAMGSDGGVEARMERGQLTCDVTFAPGVESTLPNEAGRELAVLLRAALAPAIRLGELPKCAVQVHCLVLEADGSEFGAAVCGSTLALADAGVPLTGLVAGCGVNNSRGGEEEGGSARAAELVVDPSSSSRAGAAMDAVTGTVDLAQIFTECGASPEGWAEGVTQCAQSGQLEVTTVKSALGLARSGCRAMRRAMVDALAHETSIEGREEPSL